MTVVDNPNQHRFELVLDDGAMAFADYVDAGDRLFITHTEVPPAHEGKGVGTALAHGLFEAARASGRRIVPQCSFIVAFARRHPEYADVLAS
jgi:predicted GNAT family acetyltransferase